MGLLKEELALYKLKKAPIPEELFRDISLPEEVPSGKVFDLPSFKELLPLTEDPREGQVLELFPPMDGLDLRFLVFSVDEENDLVRVIPLSEFVLLGGPEDVPVKVSYPWGEEKAIAQTDLWLELPFSTFARSFEGREWLKAGNISEEDLWRIRRKEGGNPLLTPEKKEFKESEAKRMAELFKEHVSTLEALQELTQQLLEFLEPVPAMAASSPEETVFVNEEGTLFFEYDPKKELLKIKPVKEELTHRRVKLVFGEGREEKVLYEGPLSPYVAIPIPSNRYNPQLLKKGLKVLT